MRQDKTGSGLFPVEDLVLPVLKIPYRLHNISLQHITGNSIEHFLRSLLFWDLTHKSEDLIYNAAKPALLCYLFCEEHSTFSAAPLRYHGYF